MSVETVYLLALLILASFAGGWLACGWKRRHGEWESCKERYEYALRLREYKQPTKALLSLAASLGHRRTHEACNVVALIVSEFEEWSTAADYWREARRIALYEMVPPVADWALYYYYREADAYLKEDLFEFSYDRANTAILLINSGEIPPCLDEEDYHQHLCAIRMMSAFRHFHGTEAWGKMQKDAEWIVRNASDELVLRLAKSLLALAGNLPRMQEVISQQLTPEMRSELEALSREVGAKKPPSGEGKPTRRAGKRGFKGEGSDA